jgi:hypothetical protein
MNPNLTLDFNTLMDGFAQLKLIHWQKEFEKHWPKLLPEEQTRLAMNLKSWIQAELAGRHSGTIQRRIHEAKFIRNCS